ncbi:unnamed protein product [Sphagnum jensenii]|uniref:Uncharacterized protein n=1 Tax=Sphagnum jensenii TaxID=128206 RepID=A0ABP0VG86_9BRYO
MLSSDCENCKSHVGQIGVSILQQWVTLNQIHYETHPPRGTNIELDLKNADIKYRFISLINPWGTPLLEEVVLTGFRVTVIDNDKTPGEPIDFIQSDSLAAILNKLPLIKIDRVLLKDCLFTYRQTAVDGAVGEIHISKINGLLSSFGTRQLFSPKKAQVNLSALLEQSGKLEISAEWNLFSDDDHGRISIGVSHLKIAELNSYFGPHEKAQLSGSLEHFSTQLDLANESISGQVDSQVAQEGAVQSQSDLHKETKRVIQNAPGLTDQQRSQLAVLRRTTHTQVDQNNQESLKLRAALLKDLVASNYKQDEVDLIKSRMKDLSDKRLSLMFNAVDQANKILGHPAEDYHQIVDVFYDDMISTNSERGR